MKPTIDLTGKQFGRLTAIEQTNRKIGTSYVWKCRCSCDGKIVEVASGHLRSGHTQSCGCLNREQTIAASSIDLVGKRFGRLVVLHRSKNRTPGGRTMWTCKCDCDGKLIDVETSALTTGNTKSCGCYNKDRASELHLKWNDTERKIAAIFNGMKQRCYNPNEISYHNYGARGIVICDEWLNDPSAFIKWALENGYKEGLTIERENKGVYKELQNGPYAPWNCKWATKLEQGNNTRRNVNVTVCGTTHTLAEWSRIIGKGYSYIAHMYRANPEKFVSLVEEILKNAQRKNQECIFNEDINSNGGNKPMQVLQLIDLPTAIPLGVFSGQVGNQAVIEELNASWRNSGTGVVFGHDTFGEKFRAFSSMIGQQITEIKDTVLRTVEAVCCPNKIQEITCQDDLNHVPACMFIPILTMPEVRPLFEEGRLSGWGVHPKDLPDEDVVGRLIKNGRFDTSAPDYDRNGYVTWTVATGDPEYDREELDKIETSRAFISQFLEEQMGEGGDELDITDIPNRMGKLRQLREVPKKQG